MSIIAKCTCGHSLTGACTSSVKECNQLIMEKTTLLPVEVVEQIENDSIERFPVTLTHGNHVRPILMQRAAYVTGATAYASKLHQVEQENADLKKQLDQWQVDFRRVQYEAINYANRKEEIEKQRDEALAEVSSLKAQRGPGWVKASERLPGWGQKVRWRLGGIERKVNDVLYMANGESPACLPDYEWLDEQPAAVREEDAVAFVERALREGWETSHDRKGWMKHSDDTPYVLTTAELYKLFKQHNP